MASTLTLTYNADGAHKEWTEATCNSIKQSLGIPCNAVAKVDFATMLKELTEKKTKGMCRTRLGRWTTRRSRTS